MNSWIAILREGIQNPQWTGVLLDAGFKSFIVLLVAGAVCILWRRRAASGRHLVWFLAVAGVLALPAFSWLVPAWQRPLWALRTQSATGNELTLTFQMTPVEATATPQEPAAVPSQSTASPRAEGSKGQQLTTHLRTAWATSALAVWLAGATLILVSTAAGHFRLGRLCRAAQPSADPDWLTLLDSLCGELQIRRRVTLLQSKDNLMPATSGWWQPVILLPDEGAEWPAERRRVVLLHELAHVKRWDCLTQLIARLACAAYWFNPLVWLATRRMCVERERACDDLVLNGGCRASEYATHLVEIAQAFRRMPRVGAITMARSSNLEGRIAAIVDASQVRRGPRALLAVLCCLAGFGLVAAIAAQKAKPDASAGASNGKPWFDSRLRAFFSEKAAQARQLAADEPVPKEVWPFFEAGMKGDWQTATNLWVILRQHAHQYEGTTPDEKLDKVWAPILECDLAWREFANWKEKYVLAYGNDIIQSIRPGSIYFGGTDPGRGVITAMSESHVDAKPFFILTQNALADGTYLDYIRAMYGAKIYTPTAEDSKRCFDEYVADAQKRLAEQKLRPGEDVRMKDGKPQLSGQVAVMSINALITKVIFDKNPDREFYVEESFPLDWMYPHLSPSGLIMKINRQPSPAISDETVRQDLEYWSRYLEPMVGGWLNEGTALREVATFAEKVYLKHDLRGFGGDPEWVEDTWAQKAYSKLRTSIAGLYAWRATNAKTPEEKQKMTQAADFAFRQGFALCPTSPEAVFRYVNLLLTSNHLEDARLVAETSLKLDPDNPQLKGLVENLKNFKPSK